MTSSETIRVRSATPDDALAIATIHVRTWQYAYKGQLPNDYLRNMSIERREIVWRSQLTQTSPGRRILVAESAGRVVGFCAFGPCRDEENPEDGEVYALYSDTAFIGRGAGSALMAAAVDALRESGFHKAVLWVLSTNVRAQAFYRAQGWSPDGESRVLERPDVTLDELRYFRFLVS